MLHQQRLAGLGIEVVQQVHHNNETLAIYGLNPDVVRVAGEDRGVNRNSVFLVATLDVAERCKVDIDALVLDHLGE
jgi:hypothetical protein